MLTKIYSFIPPLEREEDMSHENEPQVPDENLEIIYKHDWYAARAEEDLMQRHDALTFHSSPVIFIDASRVAMTYPFAKGINYLISDEEAQAWKNSEYYYQTLADKTRELVKEFTRTDHIKTLKSTPEETYPLITNYMREGSSIPWVICISFDERTFFIASLLDSTIYYPQFRNIDESKLNEKSREVLKLVKDIYEEEMLLIPNSRRTETPFWYAPGSQFAPEHYFETHFPDAVPVHLQQLKEKEDNGTLVPLPPELLPEGDNTNNPDDAFYYNVIESDGFVE